jgi:hypothetical protein
MFSNCWGYLNETWGEDTFEQNAQSIFDFRDFDLFCGLQAAILKIIMGAVSNKTTSHITRVLDLTYFSRSQRSKF